MLGNRLRSTTKLRILLATGTALVILSTLLPFLEVQWTGMRIPEAILGPRTLWSFKETYLHGYMFTDPAIRLDEWWFARYWCREEAFGVGLGFWVGPVLIFMLEAQLCTLLSAALALRKLKPRLVLATGLLSAFTIACMGFVTYALSHEYAKTLHAGFWLAVGATLTFFVTFLESWRPHRRTGGVAATEPPPPSTTK